MFPVEIEIKFNDGSHLREHWDGKDRWTRFTYDRNAKVVSAEIDPDHKVWLDVDFFNNSRVAEISSSSARHKLSAYWITFWQLMAQALGWMA